MFYTNIKTRKRRCKNRLLQRCVCKYFLVMSQSQILLLTYTNDVRMNVGGPFLSSRDKNHDVYWGHFD